MNRRIVSLGVIGLVFICGFLLMRAGGLQIVDESGALQSVPAYLRMVFFLKGFFYVACGWLSFEVWKRYVLEHEFQDSVQREVEKSKDWAEQQAVLKAKKEVRASVEKLQQREQNLQADIADFEAERQKVKELQLQLNFAIDKQKVKTEEAVEHAALLQTAQAEYVSGHNWLKWYLEVLTTQHKHVILGAETVLKWTELSRSDIERFHREMHLDKFHGHLNRILKDRLLGTVAVAIKKAQSDFDETQRLLDKLDDAKLSELLAMYDVGHVRKEDRDNDCESN